MITVFTFTKQGVKHSSVSELGTNNKCWASAVNPSHKELTELSVHAGIPLKQLEAALDKDERPKVHDLDNYSLIIVRTPSYEKHNIRTTPLAIFISKQKNNIITLSPKEMPSLRNITDLVQRGKIVMNKEGISYFMYRLLDSINERFFSILEIIEDNIDLIEHKIVKQPGEVKAEAIFSIKKTLIFFNKALVANREVVASIEKEFVAHIDKKNTHRFGSLYNELTQLLDMVGTYNQIMTGVLDIYVTSVSNNLNQVLKTLTVVSTFVLIPSLIAGIYGMNFRTDSPWNMPELLWRYGYLFALGLMAISFIATYLYFKRKGWM